MQTVSSYGVELRKQNIPAVSYTHLDVYKRQENGQKMSKSKGNAVDPFDALNKYLSLIHIC